jgi:hypothetical protein
MPNAATQAAVADAIAATVEEDLGVPLPLRPELICSAYGYRVCAPHDVETAADIPIGADMHPALMSRKLARVLAERLAMLAGFSAPLPELVTALAERLCGSDAAGSSDGGAGLDLGNAHAASR